MANGEHPFQENPGKPDSTMSANNTMLMKKAMEALRGKWTLAIGTFALYGLIGGSSGFLGISGPLVALILSGPLTLGGAIFSLSLSRGKEAKLGQLFLGFRRFTTALGTYLFVMLQVLLWSLLLVVPGIIAALRYAMVFYILAEEPSATPGDALKRSKRMMHGYKLKLFYLGLRFFLLALVCLLTLGIGFLWWLPYVHVTMALFYDDLKKNRLAGGWQPKTTSTGYHPKTANLCLN